MSTHRVHLMESSALSPYEADQVAQIAAWKARKPGFLGRTLDTLRWPIDRLFERLVPSSRACAMLKRVHQAADWHHSRDLIQQALGIADLTELRAGPLERCDGLVKKVQLVSREMITSESLLANVGGLATELLELPAEIMLALRTVHRVAACYGYPIDADEDETLVLAIIGMSLLDDPQERQRARHLIRQLEDRKCSQEVRERLVSETGTRIEDDLGEELAGEIGGALLEQKAEEGIPFLGAAIGVVLDNMFLSGVEEAAQRTFQERWLRDWGKVDEIAPAELPDSAASLGARASKAAYSTSYAISFGVVFPAALVAQAGANVLPTPVVEGFKAGAAAASRDARRLLAGVRGQPDPAPAPAS